MRERTVEAYLVERVEATGGVVRKLGYIGRRSCPDRLVGWPNRTFGLMGHHFLIETKRPGGKARDDQAREHERLRSIGFDVRVIDTIEKVDAFIEEVLG